MLNLTKQLNQKNFKKKPNKLMKAMLPALCMSTFSYSAHAAVENLVFEDDLKDIKISWDAVVDENHVGYNLYRSDTIDGVGTLVNTESVVGGNATRLSNAGAGSTYFFYVDSVDVDGNTLDTSARTAYALVDTDGDGMSDDWENTYDLNPTVDDSAVDLDKDGLKNLAEYQYQSQTENDDIKPNYADSDGDGIHDGFEMAHEGLDPGFADSGEDADTDGYSNLDEFKAGTNPTITGDNPDSGGSASTTETFHPLHDTYVDFTSETKMGNTQDDVTNGSGVNIIRVQKDKKESYMKFDVVAPGTITSAVLTLSAVSAFDGLSIHPTSNLDIDGNNWTESTLTANNAPSLDAAIATADLEVSGTDFDLTSHITEQGTISLGFTTTETKSKNIVPHEEAETDSSFANSIPSLVVTYSSGAVNFKPTKIENFTATQNSATVDLSWDAAVEAEDDLASYNIYRRADLNFLYGSPIATIAAGTTTFTDSTADADHHYQYVITAVDTAGQESNHSDVLDIEVVSGSGVTTNPKPGIVDNITAIDNTSGIKVIWEKNGEADLAGYNIYRDNVLLNTDVLVKNTLSNYTDYTADVNTEYQYRVEAVDDTGQSSNTSDVVSYSLLDTDNDGLSDHFEEKYSGDINLDGVIWDSTTPEGDGDNDGLSNLAEYNAIANPTVADTDADGMPDGFEVDNGLNPTSDKDSNWTGKNSDDDALIDPDGDGDSNLDEYLANSDVNDAKSNVMNPNGVDQFYATINPIADTYVTDQFPDKHYYTITSQIEGVEPIIVNFNDEPTLALNKKLPEGTTESIHNAAFMKFDVSQIDMKEGSPLKATLRLHRTGNTISDVAIYKVNDSSWDSAALTWNTKPTIDSEIISDLDIPGNKFTDGAWENPEHLYADIDVSSYITKGEQVSFAIKRTANIDQSVRAIDSLESDFKPELIITYTEESMDLDFDGMPDFWERRYGLNPELNDSALDLDEDGLTNIEEYDLRTKPNNTDSDGDGSLDNVDLEPSVANDFAAPVFATDIPAVVIDATGLLTDITDALVAANITAYDDFDGIDIVAAVVEGSEVSLASGKHNITLQAVDATGFVGETTIEVHINPQVSLGLDLIAESGSEVLVPVTLSGTAPSYPVTVDYQVILNEEISTGQVTFEQDAISSNLVLMVNSEAQQGDALVISFTGATNAVIDESTTLTVNINNDNFVPTVAVNVSQGGSLVSSIAPTAGLVTVTADISDINQNNQHSVAFESIDSVLNDDDSDELANTFTFDPAGLDTGDYQVKVTVAETNTDELFAIEVLTQLHVDATLTEVVADTDQDGIPDAIDTDSDVSRLPIAEGELPISVAAGLKLSLGDYAQGNDSASIDKEQLETDIEFDNVSTITNFKVEGLTVVGDSVSLVLPLPSGIEAVEAVEAVEASEGVEAVEAVEAVEGVAGVTIPETAAYRKYTEAKGWFDFVQDEKNTIGSALKDADGNCPAPGSDNYLAADLITASGLIEGNECIQLTIEDGGPNDADATANGIVVDPGVLVMDHVNLAPVVTVSNISAMSNADVTITASSTDYEGDMVSFNWVQLAGPSVTIEGVTTKAISFTAPNVLEETTMIFEVVGSDGIESTPETVEVSVTPDPNYSSKDSGGSFGWLLSLAALAGLTRRKVFKK